MPPDPFHLDRFIQAQHTIFEQALAELRAGQKRSHWMWFIFPQIAGLGSSPMAARYALSGRAEADTYLRHEVLGPRLRLTTDAVNQATGRTLDQIFGYPDNLKFHSSVTLFAQVAKAGDDVFTRALNRYFSGEPDAATLALL